MPATHPAYLELLQSGELAVRARRAIESLADCALCGRQCHADRLGGKKGTDPICRDQPPAGARPKGASHKLDLSPFSRSDHPKSFCRTGREAWVSSFFPHHGEESCLRGSGGSGTIFFTHCNLRCVFCQNYDISWQGQGRPVSPEDLAGMMLGLQDLGCHNVNFVTPSHVVPQILEAICLAAADGLRLPIVYNTGGYDRLQTLRLLDGVVDIYMPDFKFWTPEVAEELAKAPDYPEIARQAIKEMHRQVGDLVLDHRGIARRGLLVRHLVMPNDAAGARQIVQFLAREVSRDTYVNVMAQYHPAGQAHRHPSIARSLTRAEWSEAVSIARQEGLHRFDQ